MVFYNEKQQLCLETDALGASPGAGLLQVTDFSSHGMKHLKIQCCSQQYFQ